MRAGWRWVRAAAGTGLTWGLAVFGASVALWLVVGPDAADVFFPAGFAGFAFFGGVLFAVLLRVFEGGRGFDELSPRRDLCPHGGRGRGDHAAGTFRAGGARLRALWCGPGRRLGGVGRVDGGQGPGQDRCGSARAHPGEGTGLEPPAWG